MYSRTQNEQFVMGFTSKRNTASFEPTVKCEPFTVPAIRRETHRDGPTKCLARARTSLIASAQRKHSSRLSFISEKGSASRTLGAGRSMIQVTIGLTNCTQ